MKSIPQIKAVMTPFPYWVDVACSIDDAIKTMSEHDIRHLAVQEDGALIGVISERDVERARGLHPSGGRLSVGEVCVRRVYVVGLSEPLDRVLDHMAEQHLGSALVVKDGKLAGIFTSTDVCQTFRRLLRTLFPSGSGDSAA